MRRLSGVVIVRDEEKNIRECLEGLRFCDETVVVDSGSRDRTVEMARSVGAKVFPKPFVDFASQKNFGIEKASGEWLLLVDADERVSPELAFEIKQVLQKPQADGYFVRRLNRIFGRWMKHGGSGNDSQLRLARKEKAVFQGRVHERIRLDSPIGRLQNPLWHASTPTVRDYMRKLNHYTSLEAGGLAGKNEIFSEKKMKRRPLFLFFYLQGWKRGFLDGAEGFIFNMLSAYYEFVRRAKHWELMSKGGSS